MTRERTGTSETELRRAVFVRERLRVSFQIPAAWQESFDEQEQCAAYSPPGPHGHPSLEAGSLSVWLDLNRQATPVRAATARALLERQERSPRSEIREREDGSFLYFNKYYSEAESQRAVDYLWLITRAVPRRGIAVATFAFSAATECCGEPGDLHHGTIELLDREIGLSKIEILKGRGKKSGTGQ